MGLETGEFIDDLNPDWPLDTDPKFEADDHMRLVKKVIKQTFPGFDEPYVPGAIPTGAVSKFPMDEVPTDEADEWLRCDGTIYQVADYTDLGAYLGAAYGGDGIIDFGVPDYRGYFFRDLDPVAIRDPNAATREPRADGQGGEIAGSEQEGNNRAHDHIVDFMRAAVVVQSGSATWGCQTGSNPTTVSGGLESRPVNIYITSFIKT